MRWKCVKCVSKRTIWHEWLNISRQKSIFHLASLSKRLRLSLPLGYELNLLRKWFSLFYVCKFIGIHSIHFRIICRTFSETTKKKLSKFVPETASHQLLPEACLTMSILIDNCIKMIHHVNGLAMYDCHISFKLTFSCKNFSHNIQPRREKNAQIKFSSCECVCFNGFVYSTRCGLWNVNTEWNFCTLHAIDVFIDLFRWVLSLLTFL